MEFETYKEITGPHPRTLGASPCMQFLASSHPQAHFFILIMLPNTGAGLTLLNESLVLSRGIEINRAEKHLYKIRDASEKLMTVVVIVQLQVISQGSCVK